MSYGMDFRTFYSTDEIFTNSTEMVIQLDIVWPVGAARVPVFVDGFAVRDIKWGTVSR
jgi:hypothetical protein